MSLSDAAATAKAQILLMHLRRTPMARGGRLHEGKRTNCRRIASTLEERGVLPRLAARIALQLVMKCDQTALGTTSTWSAIADQIREDVERLTDLGLIERQIIVAVPKLSAPQVAALLEELRAHDPTVARTVLNAALDAAEPMTAGRRYIEQFCHVTKQLERIDPGIARTLANATFMARVPCQTAIAHLERFLKVVRKVRADVPFARTVARAACRAPDPAKAAERFIRKYETVVDALLVKGAAPAIARSLAAIASLAAAPQSTADKLLEKYQAVLDVVSATHPWVARTIALNACRATDPLVAARQNMRSYDTIVRVIQRTDPRRAHMVAATAFRSRHPLPWARRYLKELQQAKRRGGATDP